jgi:hypothetical protein
MTLNLSKAYKILNLLDKLSSKTVLDQSSIIDDINNGSSRLNNDFDYFKKYLDNIENFLNINDISKAKSELIKLAIFTQNIEAEFGNLHDEINNLIQKSDIFKDWAD